jgi:sugar diacid utilization regulator
MPAQESTVAEPALGLAAELALARDRPALGTRLQEIADEAAQELQRQVAIDDRQMRLLAHTEHDAAVDGVRLASILKQELPAALFRWLDAHQIASARHPVRLPPNPDPALAMDARVCAPIRYGDHLLGYLWLTDRDETLADAALERMEQFAAEAGVAMYRELLLRDLDRSRERELVRDILSDSDDVRAHAAQQLVELEIVERDGPAVVLVASTETTSGGEPLRTALDVALNRVRRQLAPRSALHLLRPDHVLLVVSLSEPSVRRHGVAALAGQVRDEVAASLEAPAGSIRVAIGSRVDGLAQTRESYEQALRAAKVAVLVGGRFGDVVSWEDLGIYRLLAELPLDAMSTRVIHPGLRELLARPQTHFLVHTLEAYLDRAGDAQVTSAALFVHRTTLYHRLRRVEEIGGFSLADGEERLELHLGLKVARLQGFNWSDVEAP